MLFRSARGVYLRQRRQVRRLPSLTRPMELSLVFPHQLFAPHPALKPGRRVLLLEEPLLFGTDSHWPLRLHAQKLVLHRASMTHWMHERRAEGFKVLRGEASGEPASTVAMLDALVPESITTLHFCDPVDDLLSRRLRRFAAQRGLKLIAHDTPMFLKPPGFIEQHLGGGKRPLDRKSTRLNSSH